MLHPSQPDQWQDREPAEGSRETVGTALAAGQGARPGWRAALTENRLALGQGLYFLATGLWALVDVRSFQRVTGPKTDVWLVKTVGVLVTVIGSVLTRAGVRRAVTPEVRTLAVGSAVGLGAIDVVYAAKGRISPIYLLDALLEAALLAGWFRAARPPRHSRG